ncbi:predicted protein [Naegleria gruberi]|uniref:Predicted protein n=1 Tax=Naegleria gruberi TaxID=5762 RepID=D2VJ81_NAEGR|nr:uncharacterized protein NAEGRDRAFT_49990 [Naegleria gruberi]EFC43235.1 predicted protein [Naegleria gruberi]|eukprot:XP_002675979.1 predicted protein [Naegleria gruberi strain NEG-M]
MNDDENSVKFEDVIQHFHDHSNVIIVEIDTRMKSDQLQIIRMKLRGRAILLKGKNTLIKSAIRNLAQDIQFNVKPSERKHNPESLLKICEYLNGNVGLIFTNSSEIEELIEQIQSFKFETRAKIGERSPRNIYIRSGFTATIPVPILAPMFQQLGVVFRTIVGQVESCRDCLILSEGEKIGKMQADLLEMLDMMPVIEYGLKVLNYYENSPVVWNRSYMKLMNLTTTPELNKLVQEAMDNVASIGLELDIPNSASIPHSILNGLMNICSINVDLGTGESISQFTIYELPSEILILIGSF